MQFHFVTVTQHSNQLIQYSVTYKTYAGHIPGMAFTRHSKLIGLTPYTFWKWILHPWQQKHSLIEALEGIHAYELIKTFIELKNGFQRYARYTNTLHMSLKCTGTAIYLAYGTWISFWWGFVWQVPGKKILCFIPTEGPTQPAVPSCTYILYTTCVLHTYN